MWSKHNILEYLCMSKRRMVKCNRNIGKLQLLISYLDGRNISWCMTSKVISIATSLMILWIIILIRF